MNVNESYNALNFKKIKLTRAESIQVSNIFKLSKTTPFETLYGNILDVYIPHIERELLSEPKIDIDDLRQNIYLLIMENLKKINTKFHPVHDLTKMINLNLQILREKNSHNKHKFIDIFYLKNTKNLYYDDNHNLPESAREIVERLINECSSLSIREKYVLKSIFVDGYTKKKLMSMMDLTHESLRRITKIAIEKIKLKIIPTYQEECIKEYMETKNVDRETAQKYMNAAWIFDKRKTQ